MSRLADGILGPSVPFALRLVLLALLAFAAAACEALVRGRRATRWREYLLLVVGGVLGASVGAIVDVATSSISPDYFALGKGLGSAPGLTLRSVALGARAGFCAGAVVTGLLLFAGGPLPSLRSPSVEWLLSAWVSIAAWTFAVAALFGLASCPDLRSMPRSQELRFLLVWWAHVGAYVGAIGRGLHLAWRTSRLRGVMSE